MNALTSTAFNGAVHREALAAASRSNPTFARTFAAKTMPALLLNGQAADALFADLDSLATLISDLPARLADNDLLALGRLLGLAPAALDYLASLGEPSVGRHMRADFVFNDTGASLAEINWGSRLGGYDMDSIHRETVVRLSQNDSSLAPRSTVPGERLLASVTAALPGARSWPVVIACGVSVDYEGDLVQNIRESLLHLTASVDIVPLDQVERHLQRIGTQAIVLRYFHVDDVVGDSALEAIVRRLVRLDRDGEIVLWTGLHGAVLASKGTLSVLHEPAVRESYTPEEEALVDRVVPWTQDVRSLGADFTRSYVSDQQEGLILKPKRGMSGQGVIVGGEHEAERFRELWKEAYRDDYVVQRMVETVPVRLYVNEVAPTAWRTVLGVYLTSTGPGGFVVRGRPATESAVVSAGASSSSRLATAVILE